MSKKSEGTYTITFADGRQLTGLGKNGDNYVSSERVDETIFENNLSTMTVSNGETEEVLRNMVFVQQMEWSDGTFYLAFRGKTPEEISADNMTDVQMALAELYEMIIG